MMAKIVTREEYKARARARELRERLLEEAIQSLVQESRDACACDAHSGPRFYYGTTTVHRAVRCCAVSNVYELAPQGFPLAALKAAASRVGQGTR